MENKPSYDELIAKLAETEDILEALRNQEVDAIVGKKNILMVRLKETEDQLKKQRNYLEKLVNDLEAANKELESFSYSVSHDLRAPLRTLDGFSGMLLEDYGDKLDETGKDYLNRIRKAGQTMSQLIEDMLKLSRITRAEILKEEVNLSDLARTICDELKATQPDRQLECIVAPQIAVYADKHLLEILMRNLLDNSWKYSSKCPITRIEVGSASQNEKKVYFIRDNGIGFDMKYADRLFVPFQRLHSNQEYAGTGIGLATVQRVIQRHSGKIWAESEVGKGSTFYFTLD
jgi:light-regulated signal transduction histidine kinase (bacteriophytochrome)